MRLNLPNEGKDNNKKTKKNFLHILTLLCAASDAYVYGRTLEVQMACMAALHMCRRADTQWVAHYVFGASALVHMYRT